MSSPTRKLKPVGYHSRAYANRSLKTIEELPIGTKFYVLNGDWYGHVVERDNEVYIEVSDSDGELQNIFVKSTQASQLADLDILTEEDQLKAEKEYREWYNKNTFLYSADTSCEHDIQPQWGGGIKCTKCRGWFCY